ncbi:hypothetical protein U8527_13425 [Kordia algicida OT-1]|uniref:Lipocalin-like domain-containing protein n=1 Tax=Kordia algicida OT-1 TaxID=391587 RepID=A9E5R8_9FLAO|nr:hypothetical protein [Kordia algicida]EDP95213.1 hypothetical protein KAOT1_07007 [Kordia algicida OT-1]
MKHIKAILLVVTIFSFLSFQTTDSVEGKWELFKLEDGSGEVREMSGRWMEFIKGGTLKGGNSLETTNRTGNWSYNTETKELTIGSEQNLSGEGTFKVSWIDAKTFSLEVQKGRKVYLRRIE